MNRLNLTLSFIFFCLTTLLNAQEIRLEESAWIPEKECSSCFICECLKCGYEAEYIGNDGLARTETKYQEIPIEADNSTITAYCGDEKIGQWPIRRYKNCKGSYTYTTDFPFMNTKDGFIFDHLRRFSNRSAKGLIRDDAAQYCKDGIKKIDITEIKDYQTKLALNAAKELPVSTFTKQEIIGKTWRTKKGRIRYSFTEEKVSTYIDGQNLYGIWKVLPQNNYIQIEWGDSKGNWLETELFSIEKIDEEQVTISSTNGKTMKSGDAFLVSFTKNGETVFAPTYEYLSQTIGADDFNKLVGCDSCYWEGQSHAILDTVVRNSLLYEKDITFTCVNEAGNTFWKSEILNDPYFTPFQNDDFCLACKKNGQFSSPGYYTDRYSKKNGEYYANQCVVYYDEKDKNASIFPRDFRDIKNWIKLGDGSFTPDHADGYWYLTFEREEQYDPKKGAFQKKSRNIQKLDVFDLDFSESRVKGSRSDKFRSGSSRNNNSINSSLNGNQIKFQVHHRRMDYKVEGHFNSAREFVGTFQPVGLKSNYTRSTIRGKAKMTRVFSRGKLLPISQEGQKSLSTQSSKEKRKDKKSKKRTRQESNTSDRNSTNSGIAEIQNIQAWSTENIKLKNKGEGITIKPAKKSKPAILSSPSFTVPSRLRRLNLLLDRRNMKSGELKIVVVDQNGSEVEIFKDKKIFTLDDVKVPDNLFDNQLEKINLNLRKFKGQTIKIKVYYKTKGLANPTIYIDSINY